MRLEGRHAAVLVALVLFPILAAYALSIFTPCDDSYIFAVYVRNFLEGNGLTYNGERVEGFTSPLWVVVGVVLGALGVPPPLALERASLVAGGAALFATYALGRGVGLSPRRALLPVCLLAVTGDLAFYAANGMEGPLFAALVAASLAFCATGDPRARLSSLGLPALLALLTLARPEGLLVSAVVIAYLGVRARSPAAAARCAVVLFAILLPVAIARRLYYGFWLPNTYYIKADAGLANLRHGFEYLSLAAPRFAAVLAAALVFLGIRLRRDSLRELTALTPLATLFVLWIAYVLVQGGDGLIGARMLLPVLPLLYVMTIRAASGVSFPVVAAVTIALSATLLWGYVGSEPIQDQARRWKRHARVRREVGIYLRDNFAAGTLTATNAAGIIPYYSEQPTIDMLGLNDETIAHHGKRDRSLRIGHQAGDGAYVLSREPEVILLGWAGGTEKSFKFISDREIWNDPGFREGYVKQRVTGPVVAYVRRSD